MIYLLLLALLMGTQVRFDIPLDRLLEDYAQPPSQFVEVGGEQVHLRDEGEGPPVVLIHGIFGSLHDWDRWAMLLSGHYRIIRFDLPGHGLTGPRRDRDYRIANDVAFVDAVVDTLGLSAFVLVGASLGGLISWEYTLAHPEKVTRLILMDPVAYPPSDTPIVFGLAQLPVVRQLFRVMTPRYMTKWGLKDVYGDDRKITPELVDQFYRLALRAGNRRAFLERTAQFSFGNTDRLQALSAPTLVLWGEADTWLPVEHGHNFMNDLPNGELKIYPGVGHMPMHEVPEQSAADARQFMARDFDGR